ncbi:MAG: phosphomannomutase/phosphoglucomutase [Planctomycetes bacterium]|nr:phosphomannomutase/phosphoglucomutase [Planctomycetota bacterium]
MANGIADLKHLQNGSDIRGVAMEGVPGEPVSLTPDVVRRIGAAFVAWLRQKEGSAAALRISVGMDSRISGPKLKASLIDGLTGQGASVEDAGLASTPAMFMSTIFPQYRCDGAILLTASHLPFNRNGMKFFTPASGLEKDDISVLLELAQSKTSFDTAGSATVRRIDLMDDYAGYLVDWIRGSVGSTTDNDRPLAGFKIVVDAGNGAGGFFVDRVLQPLGADTTGSQFLDPDGSFPNHVPNPEDDQAMQSLSEAVVAHKADLGVIFDTDVDRAAAVDSDGIAIYRNRLVGLVAAIILEEHPGSTIVTDSITSEGLTHFIEQTLGGRHHRFKRGYRNVINEAIRLNQEGQQTHLAIETSGHAALKENRFLDDGAYLITKLLTKMAQLRPAGKTLTHLIEALPEPAESAEFRIKIRRTDFKDFGNSVIASLSTFVENTDGWSIVPRNFEGTRVTCDDQHGDGWFLLRLSLHDPVLPLNVESERPGGVRTIATRLAAFFQDIDGLDTTAIDDYLSTH